MRKTLTDSELKDFLNEKVSQYNVASFIENDPVLVPHQFTQKEDIEISGFLTATIAWGQRKTIIKNAFRLCNLMDNSPYEFLTCAKPKDLERFQYFVHRTFNGVDAIFFVQALKNIYLNEGGLGMLFEEYYQQSSSIKAAIIKLREKFLNFDHEKRSEKHFSNILKNASAKRINMFLRWMARQDKCGVDFGIWDKINPKDLYVPLDVHTGRVARKLGLLLRKQDDWKAVEELTDKLKVFDPYDPVKYDFALFGLGMYEKF